MTVSGLQRGLPERVLSASGVLWLAAALLGQWAFFYYIAGFYGHSTLTGHPEIWNRLEALGRAPYVPGDTSGNAAFAAHALGAGIIAFGGALQLMPWIRRRLPAFHRWNGRVFLVTAVALSLSGYYLVWVRDASPGLNSAIGTSINGALILGFACLAYRHARARDIAAHQRWALRLYLVCNAQWFLRIGVFSYLIVNQLAGNRVSMGGPFFLFWTYGCYLVPLLVLEIYLRARDGGGAAIRFAAAGLLVALTGLMAIGMAGFAVLSHALVTGAPLNFSR